MKVLNLGIIGISEGNGHPYSWSAIFNGYNTTYMDDCPYPSIKNYLARQTFPDDAIKQAAVTHIWTQDKEQSLNIARAANIAYVVDDYRDMIGKIDGLLLARDDSENHSKFALPFIEQGIPVYIDKPLATSLAMAEAILSAQQFDWQVFTCSALRYAAEFRISDEEVKNIGGICFIEANVPKSWEKYAIHVIEPITQMIDLDPAVINEHHVVRSSDFCQLSLVTKGGCVINIRSFGSISSDISILIKGKYGEKKMVFSDSFSAFKQALLFFVEGIRDKKSYIPRTDTLNIIRLIELGLTLL